VKKQGEGRKHTLVAVSLVLIQTMPTAKIMRSACVDLEISELYRVDHPIFESWIGEKVGEGRKTWRQKHWLLEERRREETHKPELRDLWKLQDSIKSNALSFES
jgi:hypothetical protein